MNIAPTDNLEILINNGHGNMQLTSQTIRLTKTDGTGSIEMKEPLHLQAQVELYENQFKLKKDTDETGLIEMKEPEQKYIDVSLQAQADLYENQIKVKKDTNEMGLVEIKEPEHQCIDVSFQVLGELYDDQIKQKKDTNETGSIEESEHKYIDVSLQAQGNLYENQIKLKKETDEIVLFECKEETKDKYIEGVSLEPQNLRMDNEDRAELVMTPQVLMPEVLSVMPQLCDVVFAKEVVTNLSSTCAWEFPIINEENVRLNEKTVDLTQKPVELMNLRKKQEELYNIETLVFRQNHEVLTELKLEPIELEGSLDAQKELHNLETVDLTPEALTELKAEPVEVDGVFGSQELYGDHEVVDGVLLGPVVLQRPDVAYTKQEVPIEIEFESGTWEIPIHYEMKEEPNHRGYIDVMSFEAQAGLYGDHDAKNELLGYERLQSIGCYTKQATFGPGRPCSVRLERIHVDKKRRTCRVGHQTYRLHSVPDHRKKKFSFDLSQAREAIKDKLNNIITHTNSQTRPPSKKTVVAGSRSKKINNTNTQTNRRDLTSKKIIIVGSGSGSKKSLKFESGYLPAPVTTRDPIIKRRYNFKCDSCTKTFKTKLNLVQHKSKIHSIRHLWRELQPTPSVIVPRAPSPRGPTNNPSNRNEIIEIL